MMLKRALKSLKRFLGNKLGLADREESEDNSSDNSSKEIIESDSNLNTISRRDFLKALGVGAAGAGAAYLVPSAAALDVKSGDFSFFGGPGSPLDFEVDSDGNVTEVGNIDIKAVETYSVPTIEIPNSDNVILFRGSLPAGQQIKVLSAGISKKNGSDGITGLELQVYNQTNGSMIYSTTSSYKSGGSRSSPLASGGAGDEIIIRLSNGSGSKAACQGFAKVVIV